MEFLFILPNRLYFLTIFVLFLYNLYYYSYHFYMNHTIFIHHINLRKIRKKAPETWPIRFSDGSTFPVL